MTFKEQLKEQFIPHIQDMLNKERAHLVFLIESEKELGEASYFKIMNFSSVSEMISESKKRILHLQKRLYEYREYIK